MTCLGPSQSITTHLRGSIQLRYGGGSSARFVRLIASMVMRRKKCGGTASDDSMPAGWVTPPPFIVVCNTYEPAKKRTKVTPVTRTSPAIAGSLPIGCSMP